MWLRPACRAVAAGARQRVLRGVDVRARDTVRRPTQTTQSPSPSPSLSPASPPPAAAAAAARLCSQRTQPASRDVSVAVETTQQLHLNAAILSRDPADHSRLPVHTGFTEWAAVAIGNESVPKNVIN